MASLLQTQSRLINEITDFIYEEYKILRTLEEYVTLLKKARTKSLKDEKTLDNPINAFILIKRLTVDLKKVESQILNRPAFERDKDGYPDRNDFIGAIAGLERIRRTYLLNITDMANGILKGAKSNSMSVTDCFDIGFLLFQKRRYNSSIDWLAQALFKYSLGESTYPTSLEDLFMGLARSYEGLGDETNSQLWMNRLLSVMYKQDQIQNYREMADELLKGSPRLMIAQRPLPQHDSLCRGATNISRFNQSKLKCFYINRNNPFLKLAPFKLEQLHIDPDVDMVHDAMNDNEIQHLIDNAKNGMTRAEDNFDDNYAKYRVAKVAWFRPSYSAIMERVSKRMADFSGFDLSWADNLQVANYGIGGHYLPHCDHFGPNHEFLRLKHLGNRYATILFYLSDVTSGGGTAFIELGVTVPPKKGAAIFWRNLLPSGIGNPRTLHAACPVLIGNKWVMNRWLHEAGQEFSSPCTKNDHKKTEV